MKAYKIIDGIQTYIFRRGYGNGIIYSWISVENGSGEMMQLGDPWKAVNPPISEIQRELAFYLDKKVAQ